MNILPLASSLSRPDRVHAATARIARQLDAHRVPHRIVEAGAEPPAAILVVTGGTEHLALAALEGVAGPAILLAHPDQNSFPAALEILARLRQLDRPGRIVLLNDDDDAYDSLRRMAGYLDVRARLAAMRIGRIGRPSDWLVGSIPEPALMTATWGPEVVDVPADALMAAIAAGSPADAESIRQAFVRRAEAIAEPEPGDIAAAARVAAGLQRLVQRERLDGCAVRCFELVTGMRTTGCLALSWLLDSGVVAGCEGDVPATLTMAWLQVMTGQPAFMANPQDLDVRTNTLSLAHCTVARSLVSRYTLRSHFESSLGVGIEGTLDATDATVARIGGADLRDLFASDAAVIPGEYSDVRCRTQVRLRLEAGVADLLARPLGNHHVVARGHWAGALREYHALCVARG